MGPRVTRCQVCESPALTVRLQIGAAARLDWVFIQPSLWLELLFPQCWCFRKTLFQDFVQEVISMCIILFLLWQGQKPLQTNNGNIIYGVRLATCNSGCWQVLPSVHPFFYSQLFIFSIGMRGVLGSIWVQPGQISSPSQNTLKHHSITWTYSNRKWWVKGELFQLWVNQASLVQKPRGIAHLCEWMSKTQVLFLPLATSKPPVATAQSGKSFTLQQRAKIKYVIWDMKTVQGETSAAARISTEQEKQ